MRHKTPSLAPFVIIQLFWMTQYSYGIFQVLGGIKGQMALLAAWLFALVAFPKTGAAPAIRNLAQHGYELLFLTAFLVVNLLNMMFGRGGYVYSVNILLVLITYATVVIHLKGDYRRYRQAATTLTFVLGAIAIYDLPTIIMNPFIGRWYEFAPGELRWFGSWSFFMTYAIALPTCVAVARAQRGLLKMVLYLLIAAIVLLISVSTFAASIILMLLGIAGFIAFSIRRARTYVIIGALAAASVFIVTRFDLTQVPQIDPMVVKIATIFTIDKSADIADPNDPRVRATLMQSSLHSFAAQPLIGVGLMEDESDRLIGNHSGFVDSFARYGVLGLVWYLMFFGLRFKRLIDAVRLEPSNLIYQGRFLTASAFAIGALANPMLFEVGMSAVVFILAFSPIGSTLVDDVRVDSNPVTAR